MWVYRRAEEIKLSAERMGNGGGPLANGEYGAPGEKEDASESLAVGIAKEGVTPFTVPTE